MNNFKKGDKVLVRVMECVDEKNNQWEVLYKTGIISQESILRTDKNELYNVQFDNGTSELVWTKHILNYPTEWQLSTPPSR